MIIFSTEVADCVCTLDVLGVLRIFSPDLKSMQELQLPDAATDIVAIGNVI